MKMKVVSIVGARPQFVKLAPLTRAFKHHHQIEHRIIHTGQHYDHKMSAVFFAQLELPTPDLNLNIGSGSHAVQTGKMMEQLEAQFIRERPDVVLVYGDTNSTLAAVMAAAKIHIPVAHVEAGLRSFNRKMPEEINRVASDHCSDRLYAPTPKGMQNLQAENLASRSILTGDVMRDAVIHNISLANRKSMILDQFNDQNKPFAILTLHRPSNTKPAVLPKLIASIDSIAQNILPIVFPVHPRTRAIIGESGQPLSTTIKFIDPLAYLDMLSLVEKATFVMTDSGGLQKEAAFLETPCITLRDETEWTETVDLGINQLVGNNTDRLHAAVNRVITSPSPFKSHTRSQIDLLFGTGTAAHVIATDLLQFFAQSKT